LDRLLLIVDGRYLQQSGDRYPLCLAYLRRETRLWNAALYLHDADLLLPNDEMDAAWTALLKSGQQSGSLVFLAGERPWQTRERDAHYNFISWGSAPPDEPERLAIWQTLTAGAPLDAAVQLPELAARFRFTAGKIADVWRAAYQRASLRNPERPSISPEDLYGSAFGQSTHQLNQMAQRIPTVHSWEDIALPAEALDQLEQIVARTRHLHKVYFQWGFTHKISSNRGLVALFTGPSGTGKTMAASIVARELGLEMYRVDLSAVVSKYVGETEKNLGRIFDEAWRSNAIIFFDEADALFGKRSEVRDSHDRYANIEVNYLLQRIDSFDGVAILATNLSQNIDDAFQRRIQFTVNFPMPEVEIRRRIWSKIWPPEAPLAADVDLQFLAEQFRFSGGAIRNVALQAAFLAADADEAIGMRHLLAATLREIRKSGKLVSAADFGPYAAMLSLD
jgi:SpoVK/Ycf46/Vps4 family AAA+-type ATPase